VGSIGVEEVCVNCWDGGQVVAGEGVWSRGWGGRVRVVWAKGCGLWMVPGDVWVSVLGWEAFFDKKVTFCTKKSFFVYGLHVLSKNVFLYKKMTFLF